MELLFNTKSSSGLSNGQADDLKRLWKGLTDYGREYFQIWAEDNNMELPDYLN